MSDRHEGGEAANIVLLPIRDRRKNDPPEYDYVREAEAFPVVPAEPGCYLVTYFADKDAFGRSPIVAGRISPERALPVTYHCQIKGAPTAAVGSDGDVIGSSGGWFKSLQEWKEAMRQQAAKARS